MKHTNWIRVTLRWLIALAVITAVTLTTLWAANRQAPHQEAVTVFVSPHPDDEFQMWSLVEDRPQEYKVFAFMTRGEQTGFCQPERYHKILHEDLGELPANPEPEGQWTMSCEEARISSLLGFLEQMSASDPTIPGDFGERHTYLLPETSTDVCRTDGEDAPNCGEEPREVLVWNDEKGRGSVVMFNLGDGDLTQGEAEVALRTLLENREEWNLAPEVPVGAMVGAFANEGTRCYSYPHADHLAVEATLRNVNFGQGPQLGATCFIGKRQTMTAVVSKEAADAAFAVDEETRNRIGAHGRHYGWLHSDVYPLSTTQTTLFHRLQSFWVAFN